MHIHMTGWPGLWFDALARRALAGAAGTFLIVGTMAGGAAIETPVAAASISQPVQLPEASLGDTLADRDVLPLSMTAGKWKQGSVPSLGVAIGGQVVLPASLLDVPGVHNAELHWFSPHAVVKAFDLNPALSDAQGALNNLNALALSIPRWPLSALASDSLWVSLTYPLDVAGIDLSRARFIEVWVNDWRDRSRIRDPGVRLHIDLGVVSEDQMRAPDRPPNGLLDSEDLPPPDNQLVPAEDTGVDGVSDAAGDGLSAPPDLSTSNPDDLAGDDYGEPLGAYEEIDPRRWVHSNGTEANRSVVPLPDTEDLDLNDRLDRLEAYYEYTIDLSEGDTPYLAADVHAAYAEKAVPHPPAADNGWRLYRIPIDAAGRLRFGAPDLAFAKHVRVWVEGGVSPDGIRDGDPYVKRPLLVLGGVQFVGEFPWSSASARPPHLLRTWPNPTRGTVTLALETQEPRRVELTVCDLGGRRLRRLSEATLDAGVLRFTWDGRDASGARVAPGVYFVEARGPDFTSSARVLVIE